MNWKDVFDCTKIKNIRWNIFEVNRFLIRFTWYEYFCFNDTIYKTTPDEFIMSIQDTGLTKDDLP